MKLFTYDLMDTTKNIKKSPKRAGLTKANSALRFIALLGLFLILSVSNVLATDVDAGEDKKGCPGEEIQIGGSPTASGGVGDLTYEWTGTDGFTSDEPNPMIMIPETETTYTVKVTDADGFVCDDFMMVTPVKFEKINFSVPNLPPDGTSTATASVVVTPSDRTIEWTLEGATGGATIDFNSGLITAGTEPKTVTVRANDSENTNNQPTCYIEEDYCIGDDCCPDINSGSVRQLGPISAKITGKIVSKGPDDANEGFCLYEASNMGISVAMMGKLPKSYNYELTGVTIKWSEKTTKSGTEIKYADITWKGKAPTRKFGPIQANLTEINLNVNSSGQLSGSTTFTVNQTEDVNVGGIAVLKAGTSGTFTYSYTSSNGFQGDYDFGGISGIKIVLKKGSTSEIGTLTGSMNSQGIMTARFKGNTPGTFSTNGFNATLTKLDLGCKLDITQTTIEFTGGTGEVVIKDFKRPIGGDGKITLALNFGANDVNATATLTGVKAFNCDLSGSISAQFTYTFDITSISGNGISAKHADFDQAFSGVGFELREGELIRFDIGNATVKYKGGILFTMQNASYSAGELVFTAKVMVALFEGKVTKFVIDGDGQISIGEIAFSIKQSPVDINASAKFSANEFKGKYSGSFKGGVAIDGSVVIGSTATYNYMYFSLAAKSKVGGIPLGPSGLKINKLGGEFGYNWSPGASFGSISGSPSQGTVVIGFLLGIGDVANLAALEGQARLTLGNADQLNIVGSLKITASSPHYVTGTANVNYVLGTYEINGSLNSTVKVPASGGSAVNLNSGDINFGIGSNKWFVNAGNMTGKLFKVIDITAGINLTAPLNSPGAITGNVFGNVAYDDTFNYIYPSGFDPTSCATADATDNFLDFGIKGNLKVHLGGAINANLDANGVIGAISVDASGTSNMQVKWPCTFCGTDCVKDNMTTISGRINTEYDGSQIRIFGEATFTSGNESEKGDIDFTFTP
jgi:hypothetical protein